MNITGIIWLRDVVDKLLWKHNVTMDEVEVVFSRTPRIRFIETCDVKGEVSMPRWGKQRQDGTLSSNLFTRNQVRQWSSVPEK